jgi:hypothetical protein
VEVVAGRSAFAAEGVAASAAKTGEQNMVANADPISAGSRSARIFASDRPGGCPTEGQLVSIAGRLEIEQRVFLTVFLFEAEASINDVDRSIFHQKKRFCSWGKPGLLQTSLNSFTYAAGEVALRNSRLLVRPITPAPTLAANGTAAGGTFPAH